MIKSANLILETKSWRDMASEIIQKNYHYQHYLLLKSKLHELTKCSIHVLEECIDVLGRGWERNI
jgi:hypothetical protein